MANRGVSRVSRRIIQSTRVSAKRRSRQISRRPGPPIAIRGARVRRRGSRPYHVEINAGARRRCPISRSHDKIADAASVDLRGTGAFTSWAITRLRIFLFRVGPGFISFSIYKAEPTDKELTARLDDHCAGPHSHPAHLSPSFFFSFFLFFFAFGRFACHRPYRYSN
jgi:hypothetical protein